MGELRSLIGTRDDMLKEIAAAPPGACVLIVIDAPPKGVHVRWEGIAKGNESRILSFLATVLSRIAFGFMTQTPQTPAEKPEKPPE